MRDRDSRHLVHWAWAASASLHAVGFVGLWWLLSRPTSEVAEQPVCDPFNLTIEVPESEDEPLRFTFVEAAPTPSTPIPETAPSAPESGIESPDPPRVRAPAQPPPVLPREVAHLIHTIANRPAAPAAAHDVVDLRQMSAVEPAVDPVGTSATTAPNPSATPEPVQRSRFGGGRPVHGAFPTGRTVVYVLDISGTMGLDGKLDRARSALLATLALQDQRVRVHVVVYHGSARVLKSHELEEELATLLPSGASRHDEGVRVALLLNPDDIIFFTDAGHDELAKLRPILRGSRKPTTLHLARVGEREIAELTSYPSTGGGRP